MKGERDLVGGLNINTLVKRDDGACILIRQPYDNPPLFRMIEEEYKAVGFYDLGGSFRRRSPEEQAEFARHAAGIGLRVFPPTTSQVRGQFCYPFLQGARSLDEYLPTSGHEAHLIIEELFDDLWKAHRNNIVYGDRWSKNILMSQNFGPIHIDFDLEIFGSGSRDFEVAQMTYYTAIAAPADALAKLAQVLSVPKWFHPKIFNRVLRGHAQYFSDSPYGDHRGIIEELIDQVSAQLATLDPS